MSRNAPASDRMPAPEAPVALVADDDAVTRRTLAEELAPRGFIVVQACDGEEAWRLFNREMPDIVVTDLRMPRADGVELVRRIRMDAGSWTPIIVITSQTDLDIIKLAVQATKEAATEVLHLRRELHRVGEVAERLLSLSVRDLRQAKKARDRRLILEAMPECSGNVAKLARVTEIPRSTLYGLLREMDLLQDD